MTVLNTYYPQIFDVSIDEEYIFTFENTGPDSIEIYEISDTNVFTYVRPSKYALLFQNPNEDFIKYGGTLVLRGTALRSDTVQIYIERNTRIFQLADLGDVQRFPAEMVEFTLDKLTMICQEINNRKCADPEAVEVTTPITQEVDWYAYTKYPAAALNFALDKLTQICLEIDGAKLDEDYLP